MAAEEWLFRITVHLMLQLAEALLAAVREEVRRLWASAEDARLNVVLHAKALAECLAQAAILLTHVRVQTA